MRRFDLGATLGVCAAIVAGSACATGGVTSPDDAGGPATADGAGADAGAATDASTDRGDGGPSAGDAGVDSAADAGVDSEAGGTVDAAGDAPIDATTDAPIDSTADATGDAAADATAETGTDAAIDAPIDAPAEAPSDASLSDRGSCVTSPSDYCSAIPALAAPPVIDGVLDCGPALEAVTPAGWTGSSSLPAGNSAFVAASWRPDGLYVFIEVVTPAAIPADPGSPPFYGSGAEVYVDSNAPSSSTYDNPGAIQLVAAAPSSATPATFGEAYRDAVDQGPWAPSSGPAGFATFTTPTGFVLEALVVARNLGLSSWSPASGGRIGFDVAVNVSYPSASTTGAQGHRAGQYFFHVGSSSVGAPYADPRAFCVPTLQ